jgi:hypothetical protein
MDKLNLCAAPSKEPHTTDVASSVEFETSTPSALLSPRNLAIYLSLTYIGVFLMPKANSTIPGQQKVWPNADKRDC